MFFFNVYTVLYSSMVASWAANLEDTGMNLFETFKFFHYLLHNFEGSWFESSIHRMIINTEANANCRTVITPPVCCYLEDSNQVPSVLK